MAAARQFRAESGNKYWEFRLSSAAMPAFLLVCEDCKAESLSAYAPIFLKTQERLTKRAIPFAMLFTQTSPALRPKTQRFIEQRLADEGAPVFEAQLVDREAYRAMLSFGGTVAGLAGKGVSGLAAATANADAFVDELIARPATE